MPTAPSITHVIFDFDGLLVDTEEIYTIANAKCLEPFGKQFTKELKAGQMGRIGHDAVRYVVEEANIAHLITPEEFMIKYKAVLDSLYTSTKTSALPGAERLVRHFKSKDIPTAICTGSASHDFPLKAKPHWDWLSLIGFHVLTGDDPKVQRGKPHPDGYLETMNRFPVPPASPSNVLVFEDAPNGVRAALAAGMHCVHVPAGPEFHVSDEEKKRIQVLGSLLDFKPSHFGLPDFE